MFESDEEAPFVVLTSPVMNQPASYGKKNGMWYASPGNQGWGNKSLSRKPSVLEADVAPSAANALKPSAGRVIRIINNLDHTVQCRVLLNLRTSQPFEEVLEDLGQVLKMTGAKRMYTASGQEVRSFSQLRNEFAEIETFYLGTGAAVIAPAPSGPSSPVRRSRSRAGVPIVQEDISKTTARQRARSKSRPRVLYAPESEIVRPTAGNIFLFDQAHTAEYTELNSPKDYSLLDVMKEEPTKVIIRGLRRTFYPPVHHSPMDNSPPDKKLALQWVHGYRGNGEENV